MLVSHLRGPVLALATLGVAASLAACSSSGGSAGNGPSTTGATDTSTAATAASNGYGPAPTTSAAGAAPTSGRPVAGGTTIKVVETEFHLALSTAPLSAGTYTFAAHNAGTITHALTVDGPGVQDKSTAGIAPGSDASVTVTLKPGSYTVFCPIGGHRMEGMQQTLKVS